jgi:hypothetical protein
VLLIMSIVIGTFINSLFDIVITHLNNTVREDKERSKMLC